MARHHLYPVFRVCCWTQTCAWVRFIWLGRMWPGQHPGPVRRDPENSRGFICASVRSCHVKAKTWIDLWAQQSMVIVVVQFGQEKLRLTEARLEVRAKFSLVLFNTQSSNSEMLLEMLRQYLGQLVSNACCEIYSVQQNKLHSLQSWLCARRSWQKGNSSSWNAWQLGVAVSRPRRPCWPASLPSQYFCFDFCCHSKAKKWTSWAGKVI